jgi:hypothetical protein
MKTILKQNLVAFGLLGISGLIFYLAFIYQPPVPNEMAMLLPQANVGSVIISEFMSDDSEINFNSILLLCSPILIILGIFLAKKSGLPGVYRSKTDLIIFLIIIFFSLLPVALIHFFGQQSADIYSLKIYLNDILGIISISIYYSLIELLFFTSLVYYFIEYLKKYIKKMKSDWFNIVFVWILYIVFFDIILGSFTGLRHLLVIFLISWLYIRKGLLFALWISIIIKVLLYLNLMP